MPNGKITRFGKDLNLFAGIPFTRLGKQCMYAEVEKTDENQKRVDKCEVPVKYLEEGNIKWVKEKDLFRK